MHKRDLNTEIIAELIVMIGEGENDMLRNTINHCIQDPFFANGHIVTLVRLQCNICGKRTGWRKSVEEAYVDWSEKE